MYLGNAGKMLLGIVLAVSVSTSSLAQDSLKQRLFEEARAALVAANQAQAAYLAPTNYAAAAEHYKRAEDLQAKGGNIDRIRSELAEAVSDWQKAMEATKIAQMALSEAIQAREDARSADAENYAPKTWADAEELFRDAATRLESGNQKSAQRQGGRAETVYREAELAAIKANYLSEAETLLEQAEDIKADRYSPATFERAKSLLAQAKTELDENRYDTDRARSLAQDAKHEANLAIYLAENLGRVGRDRDELEAFVLDWQTPVKRIGAELDMPVYFDDGYEQATGQLVTRISELLSANRTLTQDLSESREQIRDMESQLATLEDRLGGASQERLALAEQLDQQARIKAKFATVEQMFDREEAIVLRSGNDVIMRLVGLTFDSGQSIIKTERFELLRKVERAINEFDNSTILVEGHTDAFGGDELNLSLSTKRAEAVKTYMVANMGLSNAQVVAIGYGEARPIANNETREGRTKNRRIDIVIRPKL